MLFRDPTSSRRGLLTFVAPLQIETEVQMKLRRFQYQRVSNVTSSNDVKVISEEEAFPYLVGPHGYVKVAIRYRLASLIPNQF